MAAPADGTAWLEFCWPVAQTISRVEITFDADWDHALESVLMGHPENVMPFTVRDCALSDGRGRVLHEIKGNHQARRVIVFSEPVTTDRLRLEMPSRQQHAPAAIFEIRAYA